MVVSFPLPRFFLWRDKTGGQRQHPQHASLISGPTLRSTSSTVHFFSSTNRRTPIPRTIPPAAGRDSFPRRHSTSSTHSSRDCQENTHSERHNHLYAAWQYWLVRYRQRRLRMVRWISEQGGNVYFFATNIEACDPAPDSFGDARRGTTEEVLKKSGTPLAMDKSSDHRANGGIM